jgi:tetratricopeptide (TPR) repeat protein
MGQDLQAQNLDVPAPQEVIFARKFIDAEKERILGNYKSALVLFDQCLSIDPNSDAVHFGIGKIFLEQQIFGMAEQAFAKAFKLDSDNKWYALSYAQVLIEQSKYKEASGLFKKVSGAYPEDLELKMDYGNTLLYSGKEKAAMKVFDEIEQVTGPSHDLAQRQYDYFISAKKYDAAAGVLQKLLTVYPEDAQLLGMLAELYKAQGKYNEALNVYRSAYASDPNNPMYQLALAEFYERIGQRDTAGVYLEKAFLNPAMEIDQKVGVLLQIYNETERKSNRRNQAMSLCLAVIKTHPEDAKSYSIYGDFLNQSGDYSGALEQFKKAVVYDPSRFALWSQILLIESDLSLTEQLAKDSKQAMELFPAQPTGYFFNGLANSELKRWETAIQSLRTGAKITVGNKSLSAQMLASLGDAYHETGNHIASDSSYEAALSYDPHNAYVLNNYSYFLSLRGEKLDRAKEMSAKALSSDPNNASYLDTHGWVLFKLGEYEGAQRQLARALELGGSESAEVLEHYGDVLYRLGRLEEAMEYWRQAFVLDALNDTLKQKTESGKLND